MKILNMRITKEKPYYTKQLHTFEGHMWDLHGSAKLSLEVGKQDSFGPFSICMSDNNNHGVIISEKTFSTKDELLGFVTGYNSAKSNKGYL